MIELITTIVILGVLASIAVPNLRVFILEKRLTTQANDFVTALMYARSEAIRAGKPVVICKSANADAVSPSCTDSGEWEQGWAMYIDSNGNGSLDNTEVAIRTGETLGGGNSMRVSLSAMAGFVSYRPSGLISPAPAAGNQAVFYFCDERGAEKARGVAIETTGRAMAVRQNTTIPLVCP